MLAVKPPASAAGGKSEVELCDWPDPEVRPGEVVVDIRATALNRADLLQMRGLYPPPPGESEVPGLECSGVVESVGPGVEGFSPGDRVMALLAGGGHAEKVAAPAGQLMPIPPGWSFEEAAALPEVAITAWTNLVAEGGLEEGETVLVVAAASGVGSFTVQLARELGARVLAAGRSMERLEKLRPLGADGCVVLGEGFVERARELNDGRGVDLILDLAGGDGMGPRCKALRSGGRAVLVGILAGSKTTLDLGDVLRRRLRVIGSVLRSRPREEKARLIADFSSFAGHRLADGRLRPVIDRTYPLQRAGDAYADLERGGVLGKVVLTVPADR
ncbi:MAG: NAD(P)H-quinone oxidoreductase [Acidobacteriota bacterium]